MLFKLAVHYNAIAIMGRHYVFSCAMDRDGFVKVLREKGITAWRLANFKVIIIQDLNL